MLQAANKDMVTRVKEPLKSCIQSFGNISGKDDPFTFFDAKKLPQTFPCP
jgi:hypothetical protein